MNEAVIARDFPRGINLGSGKSYDIDQFNIDVNPSWDPDALIDLSQDQVLAKTHECGRFGARKLPLGYFDHINAFDVLEHVRELTTFMSNCLELLADGGRMHIKVPYDLSLGAWQDPTHVRAFNQMSWAYYTDWYWYLGWKNARFDNEHLLYILSEQGHRLHAEGLPLEDLLARPRLVEAMHVTLRKRPLTPDEIAMTVRMSSRSK